MPHDSAFDNIGNELTELGANLVEIGIDADLEPGLFRDVPVLGSLIGLFRLTRSIPDALLKAKVANFVLALPTVSEKQKQRLRDDIERNPDIEKKIGTALLFLLDRFSDLEKPEILGRIFLVYIDGRITFEQFRRLGDAIDVAFIDDLKALAIEVGGPKQQQSNPITLSNLVRSGLSEMTLKENEQPAMGIVRQYGMIRPVGTTRSIEDIPETLIVGSIVELTALGRLYISIMKDVPD